MKKFERKLKSEITSVTRFARIIAVLGPRQSGKTTLIREVFPDKPYVLLEEPEILQEANKAPGKFLAKYKDGAIFDEIHNVPALFSSLHGEVDRDQTPGRFVISSSQNYLLNAQITQTLTGRAHILTLLPLSLTEMSFPQNMDQAYQAIFQGGYPQLHSFDIPSTKFFPQYLRTYIERDVRQLDALVDLMMFQSFLKLCAAKVGAVLDIDSLASDCQITRDTVKGWLSILGAGYILFTIPTYFKNFERRVIKAPRLYFYDTGLACSLLAFGSANQIRQNDSTKGALFENLVILELMKLRKNAGLEPNLYFWRDKDGLEVDLICEWETGFAAVEIKCSEDFRGSMIAPLKKFCEVIPGFKPYLIYLGPTKMYSGVQLLNIKDVGMIMGNID